VAYFDQTHQRLKYALGRLINNEQWSWVVYPIEDQAGWWVDLSLDPQGRPLLVYRALGDLQMQEDQEMQTTFVRYRQAQNGNPLSLQDWSDSQAIHQLDYPTDMVSLTYPEGTGLFNSTTWNSQGEAVISWYDRSGGNLWISQGDGVFFAEPEVVAGWSHDQRKGDLGINVHARFDRQDGLHFCYQDGQTDTLRYLAPSLDRDELVDSGVRVDTDGRRNAIHVVGDDCSVHFDSRGRPLILYQDATAHALLLARRDESGNWLKVTLRSPQDTTEGGQKASGFFAQGAVKGVEMWISHQVYSHQTDNPLQFIEFFSTPTP
jgi:hypothetical protein